MRLAIIHDDLMRRGGAEQVALSFSNAFPDATVYTLCFRPELTYPEFKHIKIHTSWFQNIAKTEGQMKRRFFPLGIWAMKSLNLKTYDIILISSTYCAKYIKVRKDAKVILYCHSPFRLAWYPQTYPEFNERKGLKKLIFKSIINYLKYVDKKYAERSDYFIANSSETAKRIQECYNIYVSSSSVIYPPVKLDNFYISPKVKDYYLVVSRFQPYKKVDLVIKTFNNLPNKKLVIVGAGDEKDRLMALASSPNIVFRSNLSKSELADLYANCKAFIFPQHEDYGITALEANASGRPVIAYRAGGVLETMIPFNENSHFTAFFFTDQTVESLTDIIFQFENVNEITDSKFIRNNAERFSERTFISKIRDFVESVCNMPTAI